MGPEKDTPQVEQFIRDGFIRIDGAFPRELAEQGCDIMWRDIPFDRHDPATWTTPIIRLPGYGGGPFEKAVNTPVLHEAFNRLVGLGRWEPRNGLGTFPVRFPYPDDPGETGLSRMNLSRMSADRPRALATGAAGTVYLCHPFLVHAAQRHRGSVPRFMAQPPLGLREPYRLDREDGTYSAVELSIRLALRCDTI